MEAAADSPKFMAVECLQSVCLILRFREAWFLCLEDCRFVRLVTLWSL